MISDTDVAYIAGLFDGEGCVQVKRYTEKKKKHKGPGYRTTKVWRVNMEIAMTDESVIYWVHDILKVGSVRVKPRKGLRKDGTKYLMQWKWRCTFRDCYYVCKLIWPDAKVKLSKIEQVIDYYSPEYKIDGNVVSMQQYKEAMSLE